MAKRRKREYLLLAGSVFFLAVVAKKRVWAEVKNPAADSCAVQMDICEKDSILGTRSKASDGWEGTLYLRGEKLPYVKDEEAYLLPVTLDMKEHGIAPEDFSGGKGQKVIFWEFPNADTDNKETSGWERTLEDACAGGNGYALTILDEQEWKDVRLIFTGMPLLELESLGETDEDFEKIHVRLFEGTQGDGSLIVTDGKIRVRGALSKEFPKTGYRLRLTGQDDFGNEIDRSEPLLGMRSSDAWNLAALYADDLKIRDKISSDLWRELMEDRNSYGFEAAFGTRMEYAELIRDGEYLGIYGLMEPIDARQLGIADSAGAAGKSEYYYKKQNDVIAPEEAFVFPAKDQVLPHTETEDETENSVNYVASLEIKEASGKLTRDAWEPIRQYMCMMRGSAFEEMAPALLDERNAADMWIFLQTIAGVDNSIKNMYYAAKLVDGGWKLYFIPWDMDMSWGNEYCEEAHTFQSYYTFSPGKILDWNPVTPMLEQDLCEMRGIIKERWLELREGILSEDHLSETMEEAFSYLKASGAYERDAKRWEESPHSDSLDEILSFTGQRLISLDEYIKEL